MARKVASDKRRLVLRVRPDQESTDNYSANRTHARTVAAWLCAVDESGELTGIGWHDDLDGLRLTACQSTGYVNTPVADASDGWQARYHGRTDVGLADAHAMVKVLSTIDRALQRERERTGDQPAGFGEWLVIVGRALGADSMAFDPTPSDYSMGLPVILPLAKAPPRVRALLSDWRAAERRAIYERDWPVRACVDCGVLTESRASDECPRCRPCYIKESKRANAELRAAYLAKQAAQQATALASEPA